jgi:hypothetical protein
MTFIECKVKLRRTDGRVLSTSVSLQVRPAADQPVNVPVDDGPVGEAKISSVRPLNHAGPADLGLPNMRFVMLGCNTSPENWLT